MYYMESKYLYGAGDASNMAPFMVQHPDVLLGGFVRVNLCVFVHWLLWSWCPRYEKEDVAPLIKYSNVCIQSINLHLIYRGLSSACKQMPRAQLQNGQIRG